ncbi:unnamed protein product [Moneuplotes crassus]|uniref:Uncharacterized protein n=1 Tax=Euplotes crassus TaxID=5936 RepID=A0AAD2D383_EUPCR|nr:unnamed protein product [Moneuplotes crassus]
MTLFLYHNCLYFSALWRLSIAMAKLCSLSCLASSILSLISSLALCVFSLFSVIICRLICSSRILSRWTLLSISFWNSLSDVLSSRCNSELESPSSCPSMVSLASILI